MIRFIIEIVSAGLRSFILYLFAFHYWYRWVKFLRLGTLSNYFLSTWLALICKVQFLIWIYINKLTNSICNWFAKFYDQSVIIRAFSKWFILWKWVRDLTGLLTFLFSVNLSLFWLSFIFKILFMSFSCLIKTVLFKFIDYWSVKLPNLLMNAKDAFSWF